MGDCGDQGETSRCDFAGGGIYAAPRDAAAGKAWFFAVLYLFYVAEYEAGAYRIFHRAHADGGARIFSPESLAEYAGHFAGVLAAWWTAGVYGAIHSGGYAGG